MLIALLLTCLQPSLKADTLTLDTTASVVHWKGTKFFGLGKHEGIVRLNRGNIVFVGERVVAGHFEVDMSSIEITDIPAHEPVPRERLRNHLLHEDFFAVERFPTASFVVRGGDPLGEGQYRLHGNLTMRGVTRAIVVTVDIEQAPGDVLRAASSFRINRHDWGIAFRGSRLTNDLVDDDIHFRLQFVLRSARPT